MVALSIIWAVGACIHTHEADVQRANNFAKWAYKVCTDGKDLRHDPDLSSCDVERTKNMAMWMEGSDKNVAFAALGPIPFAWLAAFILLYVIRAQIIGFRAAVPWRGLSRLKKLVVVFCALSGVIAILFSIVTVIGLYVDTEVPVIPSSSADIVNIDNFVTVTGTWTRTDLTNDTIMSPLQTSKIVCSKADNRCTEALASVSGNTLMSEIVDYDVQSWTPAAIVLRRDDLCTTELFTIDLNTKVVSGAGHRTRENEPGCKIGKNDKTEWSYQLSNGFKVYWDLRQKARPFPLRLIQSFFGN